MGTTLIEARIGYQYRCKITDGDGNVIYSEPAEIVLLTESWDYTYNADGLRTRQTNGTDTYDYTYLNGQLVKLSVKAPSGQVNMYFAYDADGTPLSFSYNNVTYYYATNIQGDVVGILTNTGDLVVSYTYDAWGKPLSITGTKADTLGKYNPLRYRGYVWDSDK